MNKIKGLKKLDPSVVVSKKRTDDISAMQTFVDNAICTRIIKIFDYVDHHFSDTTSYDVWQNPTKAIVQGELWREVQKYKSEIREGTSDFDMSRIVRTILLGHARFYPPFLKAMCHNIQALEKLREEVGRYNFSDISNAVLEIVRPPDQPKRR